MTENRRRFVVQEPGDVWIFAYGSLLWDPGFEPAETRPALLRGWHRCFCVSSRIYRGTPETPGLSLGLDRGGSCRGEALRIAERDREAVLAYLEEREMPEEIYSVRPIKLATDGGALTAHTLTVNRDHPCMYRDLDSRPLPPASRRASENGAQTRIIWRRRLRIWIRSAFTMRRCTGCLTGCAKPRHVGYRKETSRKRKPA